MFRRFYPAILVLVCFLLDTTVLPIVYGGVYTVPLTVVAVFLIGMLAGRMRGLLYGTFGGLLMDITSGTLGMMTFFFMAVGFLIGLIVYTPNERLLPSRRKQRRRVLWRTAWVFALYTAGEIALFVIQYFNTASIHFMYIVNIIVRALICTALVSLFRPAAKRMLVGIGTGRTAPRNREVKSF